jgi:hypothetical protein
MKGKITRDLDYREIFVTFPGEPDGVAIHEGAEFDFLNQHEDTCLVLLEEVETGVLYYADVPTDAIEFLS